MCGQISGAGILNPARVFGPAILSGNWNHHWIWWVASIMAAGQSALFHRLFFAEHDLLFLRNMIDETYAENSENK